MSVNCLKIYMLLYGICVLVCCREYAKNQFSYPTFIISIMNMIINHLIFKTMFSFYHLMYECNIKKKKWLVTCLQKDGELSSNLSMNCL